LRCALRFAFERNNTPGDWVDTCCCCYWLLLPLPTRLLRACAATSKATSNQNEME
jgi:hypothetical protein